MRSIILTILIVLAAVFAVQNMDSVELKFIIWSVKTVSALAIIIALILGMLIGALFVLPAVMRNKRVVKQSKKQISELETAINQQKPPTQVTTDFTDKPTI